MNINGRMMTSHKAKDFQIQIQWERRLFLACSTSLFAWVIKSCLSHTSILDTTTAIPFQNNIGGSIAWSVGSSNIEAHWAFSCSQSLLDGSETVTPAIMTGCFKSNSHFSIYNVLSNFPEMDFVLFVSRLKSHYSILHMAWGSFILYLLWISSFVAFSKPPTKDQSRQSTGYIFPKTSSVQPSSY